MGAIVRAFDVRPEVAEQVESMGAEFVHVDFEAEKSADGYAKEMTAEQEAATASMYDEEAQRRRHCHHDRPDPRASGAEAAQRGDRRRDERRIGDRRHGAANGGNVAGTVADEKVVTDNGVTILGYTDPPADSPRRRRSCTAPTSSTCSSCSRPRRTAS